MKQQTDKIKHLYFRAGFGLGHQQWIENQNKSIEYEIRRLLAENKQDVYKNIVPIRKS